MMRVLYVEDNEVNQALVGRVMRARRCEVVFCEKGEEALQVLAEDPNIDLVLLDIELAGTMDGVEVIKILRARNDHRQVVAVTAYAMMGDRERLLEAGCDQYLPKPLIVTDLLRLLDEYEARKEQRPAPAVPPLTVKTTSPPAPDTEPAGVDSPEPTRSAKETAQSDVKAPTPLPAPAPQEALPAAVASSASPVIPVTEDQGHDRRQSGISEASDAPAVKDATTDTANVSGTHEVQGTQGPEVS